MDELEISGKRYISSKRAAKENRYHIDYIGQLIRAGKITGSKVGRSWYVEVESLDAFLGKEHTFSVKPIIAQNYIPTVLVKHELPNREPPTPTEAPTSQTSITRPVSKGLTYLQDDEPILPKINPNTDYKIIIKKQVEKFEKVQTHTDSPKHVPQRAKNTSNESKIPWLLLLIVACVSFTSIFFISYYLKYDSTVEASNVNASVHF